MQQPRQSDNRSRLGESPAPIRLGCFVLTLLLLWAPFAAPIYLLVDDTNWESIITMVLLYGEFIFLVRLWGKYVYKQPRILRDYGLKFTGRNGADLLRGLVFGIIIVLSLFGLEGLLGWLVWQQGEVFLPSLILEGLVVSLGVGFAEELLFRGWLLDELQRDYGLTKAGWLNALLFALLHFIKPFSEILRTLPQFAGLFLLGLTLVWAKRWRRGRLGLPIGFHAGLVWGYYIINVGSLIKYSNTVPEWVTGINSNPLAGVVGLVFLSAIALMVRKLAMSGKTPQRTPDRLTLPPSS
ncbi:MAG: type II CAAX endopeptidase family protein [Nostocaceae cyanobacterium]|nr:type II CAAX endopeptidase family protein [Nostocaceae cyanobacterium]